MVTLSDIYRAAGLRVINGLALLGDYELTEHQYGSGTRERIDWYVTDPDAASVIFYYGGDWRSYDKRDFRFVADTLCKMGVNVAIPDFPQYPQHRFDQIQAGVVEATHYFLETLYPTGTVLLMGHSSGAQLASLLALNDSLLSSPERILGMIGLSGPYDFYPFTQDDHWDLFGPEENYPLSQPVNFVRADAPELYLLHGEIDNRVRRGHSKSLMEKQLAVGGKASREVYPDMGHADTLVSFSRIHRRNSKLIRDIQSFIQSRT